MKIKVLVAFLLCMTSVSIYARPVTITNLHDSKIFTAMIYEDEPHSVKFTNSELAMYTDFIKSDSVIIIANYLKSFNGDIQTDEELAFRVSTHLRNYLKK